MDFGSSRLIVVVTGLPGTGKSTIADAVGSRLGAAVLAHDWAMSGLRSFPALQDALDAMDPPGHRPVGWSILLALARSQLRRKASVVLDGVARRPEIDRCQALASLPTTSRVESEATRDDGPMRAAVLRKCPGRLNLTELDGAQRHRLSVAPTGWPRV